MKPPKIKLLVLFTFYSVCFLGAGLNHGRDILLGGFLPYRDVPLFYNLFWTSLAFVDPLVPLLFVVGRAKSALLLTIGVIAIDVCINTHFAFYHRDPMYDENVDLQAQTAFLCFVLATAQFAWNTLSRAETTDAFDPDLGAIWMSKHAGRRR